MSKILVDLREKETTSGLRKPARAVRGSSRKRTVALVALVFVVAAAFGSSAGVYSYWRHLRRSPQYELARLVAAAKQGDQETIDEIVDTDAVVDDFVSQVTGKAIELYGRGLPKEVIDKVRVIASPLVPVIKQRARSQYPAILREKTKRFEDVPFWVMVVGADVYLRIEQKKDLADVSSVRSERPLSLKMKRSGGRWRIVAVKDDELAKRIASRIGEEMIALARKAGRDNLEELGRRLGIDGIGDLIRIAGDANN